MSLSPTETTRAPESAVDVDAYFARIGYTGPRTPDLDTLSGIIYRHTLTIPFENLNPYLRYPVLLDGESLQRKIVGSGRGGYCYEQNNLLSYALQALGFEVRNLAARVIWNRPDDDPNPLPRKHMCIRVTIDGQPYLVDVGFGGMSLTGPLRLEPDVAQSTPHESFRLLYANDLYELQADVRGEWKAMYRFDLQPQLLSDYEMANWHVANHPESQFVTGLSAALPYEDRRCALHNNSLSIHHLAGDSEQHTITGLTELRDTLTGMFRITLPGGPEVNAALERLLTESK